MEWTADAFVLGVRPHGESSVILEVMTEAHGRFHGLVRSGRTLKIQPILQPGNDVRVTWRSRLEENLGHFSVELLKTRTALCMDSPAELYLIQTLCAHLRYLPERDPHADLYRIAHFILDHLTGALPSVQAAETLARFELALLSELGFGIDLESCAATGARNDLAYVSPKSGKAVSRAAGAPYAERLLPLPPFLVSAEENLHPNAEEVCSALALTGFFLERHVCDARKSPFPEARSLLLQRLSRKQAGQGPAR